MDRRIPRGWGPAVGLRVLWASLGVSVVVHVAAVRLVFAPFHEAQFAVTLPALGPLPRGLFLIPLAGPPGAGGTSSARVEVEVVEGAGGGVGEYEVSASPETGVPVEEGFPGPGSGGGGGGPGSGGGIGSGTGTGGGAGGSGTGEGIQPPVPLTVPWLRYPEAAIEDRVSGTVVLEVRVGLDGRVEEARVLRGLRPDCDGAAMAAALGLRFEPAREGGLPVSAWTRVEIDFDLGGP